MSKRFDYEYIVIGGGTAGVIAARQLAEVGRRVALVEQEKWGGGNSTYDLPQKILTGVAHKYANTVAASRMGISSANLRYNYPTIQHFKDKIISKTAVTRKDLEEKGITCIRGKAHFVGAYDVAIEGQGQVSGNKFLIATGSVPANDGITGLDTVSHLTPKSALELEKPPKAVLVVGGGASGCEIAEYFAELGAKVVIVEAQNQLLPAMDEEVGQVIEQYFSRRLGIKVFTQTKVVALEKDKVSKRVVFQRGGQEKTLRVETIVIATGSTPNTDLGLKNAGVKFTKNGVNADRTLQTSARNIWAAGDVLGSPSSVERASYTAEVAVLNMLGRGKTFVNYSGFMEVIDTYPQIANVGMTEKALRQEKRKFHKAVIPLSMAAAAETDDFRIGFIKILVDAQGKILGASIVGPHAAIVLQELALAIRHNLPLVQVASTPHVGSEWNNLVKIAAKKLLSVRVA